VQKFSDIQSQYFQGIHGFLYRKIYSRVLNTVQEEHLSASVFILSPSDTCQLDTFRRFAPEGIEMPNGPLP
jgi:hypothetical protein